MSYTYHGTTDLIALPNRTVQTYPSGLVRVERSFICRKTDVAKYRATIKVNEPMPQDDGAPAIDGLYIFPEPQEVVRDDGFVEFRVTAYGRTNTTGQATALAPFAADFRFTASFQDVNPSFDPNVSTSSPILQTFYEERIRVDIVSVRYKFCIPANTRWQRPEILDVGGVFLYDTDVSVFSQSYSVGEIFPRFNLITSPKLTQRVSPVFNVRISEFTRTNFGKYDEIIVTYQPFPPSISFGLFVDEGAVPIDQIILSVDPLISGVTFGLFVMPNANGVNVTINGETNYYAYDSPTSNVTRSGQYVSLTIGGLEPFTVYEAAIAAVNKNGPGAEQKIKFKTKLFEGINLSGG